jgi:hypothetical protein
VLEREKTNIEVQRTSFSKQIRPIEAHQKQLELDIEAVKEQLKERVAGRER